MSKWKCKLIHVKRRPTVREETVVHDSHVQLQERKQRQRGISFGIRVLGLLRIPIIFSSLEFGENSTQFGSIGFFKICTEESSNLEVVLKSAVSLEPNSSQKLRKLKFKTPENVRVR